MNRGLLILLALVGISALASATSLFNPAILFSSKCTEAEDSDKWSGWSTCGWPHGDLRVAVAKFLKSVRQNGCRIPPKGLIRKGFKYLKASNYTVYPLYKKIPSTECGFCGRNARCCTKGQSFLLQSFESRRCSQNSPPCTLQPMTEADIRELNHVWYPGLDVIHPKDMCDFKPYLEREISNVRRSVVFPYIKELLCQVLGTTRPTINCKSVDDACKCCCFGFDYNPESEQCEEQQGDAVEDTGCE